MPPSTAMWPPRTTGARAWRGAAPGARAAGIVALALLGGCALERPAGPAATPALPSPPAPETRAVESPAPPAPAAGAEAYEEFRGHYRARAKTGYATVDGALAPLESFATLEELHAYLAPDLDPHMRARHPHLAAADGDPSGRVAEERRNVSVVAYLLAVKHEGGARGDNDYHVMLGSSALPGEGLVMTAEASALPPAGAQRALLASARASLLAIVGPCRCQNRFIRLQPAIRVRVSGSLFFDAEHASGAVGPGYARPATVWEIHPILAIERIAAEPGGPAGAASAAPGDPLGRGALSRLDP